MTEAETKMKFLEEQREKWDQQLIARIRYRLHLSEKEPPAIKDEWMVSESEEEEEEEEDEFPELTSDQEEEIDGALSPRPGGQVLSEGFRLQITRADMSTLAGLSWLNDEVL